MSAIQGGAIRTTAAGFRYTKIVVGGKGRKSLTKKIGCRLGASYIKRGFRKDLQGHHSIPLNVGGKQKQKLIFLPSETHRMFHYVLHVFLKNDPALGGLGNWTSKNTWSSKVRLKKNRIVIYNQILEAAKLVDRFCKLKKGSRIAEFVAKHRKDYIGQ